MAENDAVDEHAQTDHWVVLRVELHQDLEEAGLGRHAEALLGAARPALRLVAEDASKRAPVVPALPGSDDARQARRAPPEARIEGSDRAFGRTRLGGVPDVPEGFRWPTRRRTRVRYGDRIEAGAPLSFVAQINLAELPPIDGAEPQLPTNGMLWFFYDARFLAYDAEDADGFHVVYSEAGPDDLRLAEARAPVDEGPFEVFDPVVLAPRAELSLPSAYADPERGLPLMDEPELETYHELVERRDLRGAEAHASTAYEGLPTLPPPVHRVLGCPHLIQGDNMEAECEASTRRGGVLGRLGDAVGSATAGGSGEGERRAFERTARDSWRLLLQAPVQGTAADGLKLDGLKLALALLWERRDEHAGATPVLVCHNEVVVECGAERAADAKVWLEKAMIDGMDTVLDSADGRHVPTEVEAHIVESWGGS